MNELETRLEGLRLFEPRVMNDSRGWFYEAFQAERYAELGSFVQDNVSFSHPGVLRGIHLQNPHPQGKLIQVLQGRVWDVAVDLRAGSPTFGEWEGHELSVENHRQYFIPGGFGHGFVVLDGPALLSYKCTDYYHGPSELTVLWNDPDLAIRWPASDGLTISEKDLGGVPARSLPEDRLVPYRR